MAKRTVMCADGTWNKPEQTDQGMPDSTNVVKITTAVRPEDSKGMAQVVYYHKGVGARGGLWDHLTGGAFGRGISRNIEDIYLFLISNYAPGDELFLFGFSRGAYTARRVAGFIRNCGILKPEFMSKYKEAYDLYRDRTDATHPSSERAVNFRKQYSWPDFNIRFIGVWDTVGALGIPVTPLRFWTKKRYEFHDVELSSHVDYAYQALAIDERRKPFLPAVWKRQPGSVQTQILEQAWFPGVHCDVGGGYPITGLSDGALLWMCDRAAKCGLDLDATKLPKAGDPNAQMGDSMTLFYRVLGKGTRRLGATNPLGEEGPHQSTMARTTSGRSYQPQNLKVFEAQKPDIYRP
ncbi:MAG TPA: DUF2235 domain-containing protein [Acidiferrobacterales bacterium]|nr:DUF2235 domain-containing protein [Acidiferrobacterales bacterium]